jgi:hypothetical protein
LFASRSIVLALLLLADGAQARITSRREQDRRVRWGGPTVQKSFYYVGPAEKLAIRLLISLVSRRQLVGLEPGDDIHVRLRRGRHIYMYESDAMEPAAVWQIRGFDRYDDQLNRFKVATQR